MIEEAEDRSFSVCELCGGKGEIHSINGWVKTLCEKHHNEQIQNNKLR